MDGDLISRKTLLEILNAKSDMAIATPAQIIYANVAKIVELQPAVDAEPVRRAQWKAENRRCTLCDTYICSECGNMVMQAEGFTYSCTYNYCPNCGAMMDGGGEEYGNEKGTDDG